jgi:predicted Fe-Mo cluster-binding NifX family protein
MSKEGAASGLEATGVLAPEDVDDGTVRAVVMARYGKKAMRRISRAGISVLGNREGEYS